MWADERGFALSESGASPAGCYVKLAVQDVDEFGFLVAVDEDRADVLIVGEGVLDERRVAFAREVEAEYFGADRERAVLVPVKRVYHAMRLLLSIITYNFGNVNRKLSFYHRKLNIGT